MFRTLAITFLLSLIALCDTFSAAVNCSHFIIHDISLVYMGRGFALCFQTCWEGWDLTTSHYEPDESVLKRRQAYDED